VQVLDLSAIGVMDLGMEDQGKHNENSVPPVRGELHDKQSERDTREIPIDKVGVRGLRFPIKVLDRANRYQDTVATIGMYVDLPKEFKGTHMSRFIEVLNSHGRIVHVQSIPKILAALQEKFNADTSHIELEFPYFLVKHAPVSGLTGLMDYQVKFDAAARNSNIDFVLSVTAGVTTVCPCSKAISEHGAHNQRGLVTVHVRFTRLVWIEELIEMIERSGSCDLYPILKREDEKYVTECAYANPVFVEDLVRNVALQLDRDSRITWYKVEAENFESIHNHNAYACVERGLYKKPRV